MYLILTASKDTYITNKIINQRFRAIDANVGRAGTLDLFKLYNESNISGETNPVEISRILIKFDTDALQSLTSSVLDINDPSFSCTLKMCDVLGTQSVPRNFNITVLPLSQSFDEGDGRDIGSFADIDVANFVTASYSGGTVYPWFITGAAKIGLLGSPDIDVIGSGSLGAGIVQLASTQNFSLGNEDLSIDVTRLVSATMSGQIPDCGYRVSFIDAEESDDKTRFVKRLGSRHSKNVYLRPTIHVSFDDSIHDNHESFIFDSSGSLFLSNFHRSSPANIVSGSSLIQVTGENCMILKLSTGSYTKTVNVSMYTGSTTGQGTTGLYYASFAIPSSDSSVISGSQTVSDFVLSSGSITFTESWESIDGSVKYFQRDLTVRSPSRNALSYIPRSPNLRLVNLQSDYNLTDSVRLRLFGIDTLNVQNRPAKSYRNVVSEIFEKVFYRVIDTDMGKVVIPFDKNRNGTLCSTDSDGMFFDFKMSSLVPGRVYHFEFLIIDRGIETKIPYKSSSFRVNVI
ncbi:MAG: hypothetical protein EBZ49_01710 [Proteobacteria bacterium]|nr:hypothetical protein [Pseudomonadota bacterium]